MRAASDWGKKFMEKFNTEGATKGSGPDAKPTPATRTSSRLVESAKKLTSLIKTAPRCSSQQVKQEAVDNNLTKKSDKQKQEEMDMEITYDDSINQEAKIDITKILHSMKRRKRSARNRVKSSAPWVKLHGFLNCKSVVRAHRNDRAVGSKKMKKTCGGTKLWRVYNRAAKGKKNVGGERDAIALLNESKGSRSADTNAAEHVGVPKSDTLSEFKEQCGVDADESAFKQIGVPTGCTSSEVKLTDGANEISLEQTVINNILIDFRKSKGAVANDFMQTTDAISQHQAKENNAEFDHAIFSGLDLKTEAENFKFSSAESALASLYGDLVPDSCVQFAVKLLMDETPLPTEAVEYEQFFRQKMYHKKSTTAGPSQSSLSRKN